MPTEHVVAAFKGDLAPYKTHKGTIGFALSEPVPGKLIETHREVPHEGSRRTREGQACRAEEELSPIFFIVQARRLPDTGWG